MSTFYFFTKIHSLQILFANVLAFIVDHISTAVQWACMWLKFAQLVVAWTRKVVH